MRQAGWPGSERHAEQRQCFPAIGVGVYVFHIFFLFLGFLCEGIQKQLPVILEDHQLGYKQLAKYHEPASAL